MSANNYPLLAATITLGGVKLRNRVAHASMSTRAAVNQRVTDKLIGYHVNRARGGCAMSITEPLASLSWQTMEPYKVCVYNASGADGLKRWADAVESLDCRLVGQLQDPGRGMHLGGRRPYAYSATSLPDDLSWTVPHALDIDDVKRTIDEFAAAARLLQTSGFSGIELSAGHGHLMHQFLSPRSNTRTDIYGGDFDGRLRFVKEIILAIRAATGRPFILAVKLPGDDGVPGSVDLDLAEQIVDSLTRTGEIDALSFCQGSHHRTLEYHLPDMHAERAPYNDITKRLKAASNGVPVAVLGRIVEPVQAEQALSDGVGDFVQLGRALVADPAWAVKAFSSQEHEARWCVSCNTCWGVVAAKQALRCDNNPLVGAADEALWKPTPAAQKKRIVVVGAGIAGLEAAWIAAARGHEVTVFGSGASYGGKTALMSRLPGCEQVSSIYDYQIVKGNRAGVRYEFGLHAGLDDILALNPDTVILATGSTPRYPDMLPIEWHAEGFVKNIRDTAEMLLEGFPKQPGTAVLFDADHTAATYATAHLMADIFENVVIATPRLGIATDEPLVVQQGIIRRLSNTENIRMEYLVEPSGKSDLIEGQIDLVNVYNGNVTTIHDVALFTYSTARKPNDDLATPLKAKGFDVRMIGDCFAPRAILYATSEGHQAGIDV